MNRVAASLVTQEVLYYLGALVLCLLPLSAIAEDAVGPAQSENGEPPQSQLSESGIADTNKPVSDPNTYDFEQFIDPNSAKRASEVTSELVGFVVRGRRLYQRLRVEDMDSLVTSDGKRLLPLLRILHAFKWQVEEELTTLRFSPEGVGPVRIDLEKRELEINGQTRPLSFVQAKSEITFQPDVYLSAEDLGVILDMDLEWDNALYEYRIQLDRMLSVWKLDKGISLLKIRAKRIPIDLPEVLPAADRSQDLLHFLEFNWSPSYQWRSPEQSTYTQSARSSTPRETVWGNFNKGQYKIQISHPELIWENNERQCYWKNYDPYIAKTDWFEWVYRLPSSELALGDSSFGLSELIYPTSNVTGIRVNGLTGYNEEELESDRSSLGLRQFFGRPYVFEGTAPLGAAVEILLNDRSIATQEVFPEEGSAPGMGTYRFEDIELPGGILNEVVIVITEANGNEMRVEKSIIGTPRLLPKNRSAYLGVVGSKRELWMSDKKGFEVGDFFGEIASGRLLYGLTDRLTIGGILGFQQDHYHIYLEKESYSDRRSFPESSSHLGGLFSYLPFNKMFLSGEFGISQGQGEDKYKDMAFRLRGEYLPSENFSVDMDLLNLGADYFDGQDTDIADRRGGEIGISWKQGRKWTLEGSIGKMRNNLDGQFDQTLLALYMNIGLRTTIIPGTTLTFKLNRLDSNLDSTAKTLSEVRVRTSPFRGLDIYGQSSFGGELELGEHNRFFSRLRLKNAPRFTRPTQYWTIRKSLASGNAVAFTYNDIGIKKTVSVTHNFNTHVKDHPLRVRTEVLQDLLGSGVDGDLKFRNRTEYLLDSVGYKRLGLTAEYQGGEYRVMLYLSIKDLYTRHENKFRNINERRIRTSYGAVHGRVFLDYNDNSRPDPGEPGIPEVKVCLGDIKSTFTDENGYYILPGLPNLSTARIYLDIDTVPAIYTVTHGTQLARIYRDSLTEVNLSLAPMISLAGYVVRSDPNEQSKPISGVRVILTEAGSEQMVGDSLTAEDGSYYIGDVKPGDYNLQVDIETLPPIYELSEPRREIKVVSTKEEFQEIKLPDFVVSYKQTQD